MKLFFRRKQGGERGARVVPSKQSQRTFLKAIAAVVGGAGFSQLSSRSAEATYTTSPSGDTVDTNLTVQGNLLVPTGNVGIGTTTPQGKLDVAGEVLVTSGGTSVVAIGTDGVTRQSYYAP